MNIVSDAWTRNIINDASTCLIDASRRIIDYPRALLQIVASLLQSYDLYYKRITIVSDDHK